MDGDIVQKSDAAGGEHTLPPGDVQVHYNQQEKSYLTHFRVSEDQRIAVAP